MSNLHYTMLLNKSDPSRLTQKEIEQSWGSVRNFVQSYGLKEYDPDDLEVALQISRGLKEGDREAERQSKSRK